MPGSKKNKEKHQSENKEEKTDKPDLEQIVAEEQAAEAELSDVEKEVAALKDRYLRLQADFDNFRKRSARENVELVKTAACDFIESMLPVIDNFELGLKAAGEAEANESVVQGFKLVYDQLLECLKKAGVTPFDSEGEEFDHNLHDCVSRLPSAEYPENIVVNQIRRGYRINDKVLRHAQVVVSAGAPETSDLSDNGQDSEGDGDLV